MVEYILLFIFAFIYEFGIVAFQRAITKGSIKRSIFLIGIYEPMRWFMVAIIAKSILGSFEQIFRVGIIVFAFQLATFINMRFFGNSK